VNAPASKQVGREGYQKAHVTRTKFRQTKTISEMAWVGKFYLDRTKQKWVERGGGQVVRGTQGERLNRRRIIEDPAGNPHKLPLKVGAWGFNAAS